MTVITKSKLHRSNVPTPFIRSRLSSTRPVYTLPLIISLSTTLLHAPSRLINTSHRLPLPSFRRQPPPIITCLHMVSQQSHLSPLYPTTALLLTRYRSVKSKAKFVAVCWDCTASHFLSQLIGHIYLFLLFIYCYWEWTYNLFLKGQILNINDLVGVVWWERR